MSFNLKSKNNLEFNRLCILLWKILLAIIISQTNDIKRFLTNLLKVIHIIERKHTTLHYSERTLEILDLLNFELFLEDYETWSRIAQQNETTFSKALTRQILKKESMMLPQLLLRNKVISIGTQKWVKLKELMEDQIKLKVWILCLIETLE